MTSENERASQTWGAPGVRDGGTLGAVLQGSGLHCFFGGSPRVLGLASGLVGRTGFEPVTSSVSGNAICRLCFRIFALNCCRVVHARPLASIANSHDRYLVGYSPLARGQTDLLLGKAPPIRRLPSLAWEPCFPCQSLSRRMWPVVVVSVYPAVQCINGRHSRAKSLPSPGQTPHNRTPTDPNWPFRVVHSRRDR
jgi:hypothetical protein